MKEYLFAAVGIVVAALAFDVCAKTLPQPHIAHYLVNCRPVTYKDAETGIVFSIGNNGRYLIAMNSDGKRLWTRDPHDGIPAYRISTPCIIYLGAGPTESITLSNGAEYVEGKTGHYIALNFNNSQFGIVDTKTGVFVFLGQN